MWLTTQSSVLPFQIVNEMFAAVMTEDKVFEMVSKSQEFDQVKVSSGSNGSS